MYFSRLKASLILGACILGALLCIPNLARAPAPWLPWRQVHLGLDLQGGSYLLMQVDMNAVIKQRLNGLIGSIRQALVNREIFYRTIQAEPTQNRVAVQLQDPTRLNDALAALQPLVSTEGALSTPDLVLSSTPGGQIDLTLSEVALRSRAAAALQQSIEIVRRRIDATGVVDPQVAQEGELRIVVQLPGIGDPERIKQLLGETAHMTFQLVDETANPASAAPPPPGVLVSADAGQPEPEDCGL